MSTNPQSLDAAFELHQSGQQSDARQICRTLLQQQPNYIEAWLLLGIIASQTAQYEEAIACFRRVLALKPNDANSHNNLGNVFRMQGKLNEAIAQYQTAIALNPYHTDAYFNLGIALQEADDLNAAAKHYRRAIALNPNYVAAHNRLGIVLRRQANLEDAIASHERAIALDPTYAEAYDSLGNALRELGNLEGAIDCHHHATILKPSLALAHYNLGNALLDQGSLERAIASYNRAIELQPPYHDAQLGKAMSNLLWGNLPEGFADYESRWGEKQSNPYRLNCPLWDGSPLNGRKILLVAEQGFGDTIQFIRYAADLAQQGGSVVVGCPKPLLRLLATVPGVSQITGDITRLSVDVYAPVISVARHLGTTLDTIPATVPYLTPPPNHPLVLKPTPFKKVGIVWAANDAGSSRYPSRRRSCPLIAWQPLLTVPGIALVSLQKGDNRQEVAQVGWQEMILDLGGIIDDFADTAAIASQLDLIITVDTAIAHLAGALAKPVWVLLPFSPDWRWQCDRNDSPWYPTMRLFRHRYPGDWAGVMTEVADALWDWVKTT